MLLGYKFFGEKQFRMDARLMQIDGLAGLMQLAGLRSKSGRNS